MQILVPRSSPLSIWLLAKSRLAPSYSRDSSSWYFFCPTYLGITTIYNSWNANPTAGCDLYGMYMKILSKANIHSISLIEVRAAYQCQFIWDGSRACSGIIKNGTNFFLKSSKNKTSSLKKVLTSCGSEKNSFGTGYL